VEVAAMTTEAQEHKATTKALDEITAYVKPGTNEGISWTLSRLTDDLFGDSFLAGGDATPFTPSGKRGTLHGQLSTAWLLSGGGGAAAPTIVPITMTFDLNEGVVKLSWTPPGEAAKDVTFKVELYKNITGSPDASQILVFNADTASDDAAYALTLMLL
jgi:hypothetical protein